MFTLCGVPYPIARIFFYCAVAQIFHAVVSLISVQMPNFYLLTGFRLWA